VWRLSQARWIATREEELVVSMVKLGPLRLRKYEIRAARIPISLPRKRCASISDRRKDGGV
jgi:hypothetical protein